MYKYFNYNYNDCRYYEVAAPSHDHYTFNPATQSWYEDILIEDKGYSYRQMSQVKEWEQDRKEEAWEDINKIAFLFEEFNNKEPLDTDYISLAITVEDILKDGGWI